MQPPLPRLRQPSGQTAPASGREAPERQESGAAEEAVAKAGAGMPLELPQLPPRPPLPPRPSQGRAFERSAPPPGKASPASAAAAERGAADSPAAPAQLPLPPRPPMPPRPVLPPMPPLPWESSQTPAAPPEELLQAVPGAQQREAAEPPVPEEPPQAVPPAAPEPSRSEAAAAEAPRREAAAEPPAREATAAEAPPPTLLPPRSTRPKAKAKASAAPKAALDEAPRAQAPPPWSPPPLPSRGPAEVLAVAADAALAAGELLRARVLAPRTAPGEEELEEKAAAACAAVLREAVSKTFPEHAFADEGDAAAQEDAEWLWNLDPMVDADRTGETAGPALAAVALAASAGAAGGGAQVGVVYDPFRDELFTAVSGGGAELNGAPLRVPGGGLDSLRDALVGAEPTQDPWLARPCLQALYTLSAPAARGVRVLGCTALSLAWVACGRLDAFYAFGGSGGGSRAAGALLVQEAGGRVTDSEGLPAEPTNPGGGNGQEAASLCATCGGDMHEELVRVLRQARSAHQA